MGAPKPSTVGNSPNAVVANTAMRPIIPTSNFDLEYERATGSAKKRKSRGSEREHAWVFELGGHPHTHLRHVTGG